MPPEAIEWEAFWQQQGGLKPGQHVSVFGPTGTGKTTALVYFCEQAPKHAILVVTKSKDRLVQRLVKERGWQLATDPDDILTGRGSSGRLLRRSWGERWDGREKPPQRIVFHPKLPKGLSIRQRAELLEPHIDAVLSRAYERGELLVAMDETMFAAMELNMGKPFTLVWNEGRSLGLSFAAAMQRPVWIPPSSSSAPSYLLIFGTTSPKDQRILADMAGYDNLRDFRADLDSLPEHHHLLVVTRGTGTRVYTSRVVIRKGNGGSGEKEQ